MDSGRRFYIQVVFENSGHPKQERLSVRSEKKAVEPQVTVSDQGGKETVVKVGPLSWSALKEVVRELEKAELPLPMFEVGPSGILDIGAIITSNLPVLSQWVFKHPPIAAAFVIGATGLTEEELDQLSSGEFVRVARAAWKAVLDDGLFTELSGFFAESLPLSQPAAQGAEENQPSESPSQPTNGQPSADASKPESAAQPAGA